MAMQALRFRRILTSLPATLHRALSSPPTTPSLLPLPGPTLSPLGTPGSLVRYPVRFFSEGRQLKLYKEGDEITEDTILFEGCDYNHWLITVDFPKNPQPTPEEMVATYERICAQGLNISIEEAKKRIYACSTTTYQGFQAIMTEAESQKFTEDVPGVVFVLPDSYIDPANKEYGGDKYENGVITPRPPPFMPQKRERRPRSDQFRGPRHEQSGSPQNYPGKYQNPQYNQQRPMQGDHGNLGPSQNFPRQDPGFPERRDHGPPHNFPTHQNFIHPVQERHMPTSNRDFAPRGWDNNQVNGGGKPVPSFQSNYNNYGPHSNYQPQDQRGFQPGNQQHYGYQEQGFARDDRSHSPPAGGSDDRHGYGQAYPRDGFSQMEQQQNMQPGTSRVRSLYE